MCTPELRLASPTHTHTHTHKFTLFLVAGLPLTLTTLAAFLQQVEQILLLGQAMTVAEAQPAIDAHPPTLLLIDIDQPAGPDLIVVTQLRRLYPALPLAVTTLFADMAVFQALLAQSIQGYLTKDLLPQRFVHALELVALGGSFFSPTVTAQLQGQADLQATTTAPTALTLREQALFYRLCQGASFRTIAQQLHLSEQTVRNYASTLYEKLGVRSKGELMARYGKQSKHSAAAIPLRQSGYTHCFRR